MRVRGLFLIVSATLLFSCVNTEYVAFAPNLEWNIRGKISRAQGIKGTLHREMISGTFKPI